MLREFGRFAEHCHQSLPHARIVSHLLPVLGRYLRSAPTLCSRAHARGRDTNESLQNCVCLPLARKTPHGPSLRTSCPTACYISLSTLFVSRFRPQNNGHQRARNFTLQGNSVRLGRALPAPFIRRCAGSPPTLVARIPHIRTRYVYIFFRCSRAVGYIVIGRLFHVTVIIYYLFFAGHALMVRITRTGPAVHTS